MDAIYYFLIFVGLPVAAALAWGARQRGNTRRAEARAAAAEYELQQVQGALSVVERERMGQLRVGSRPMDTPPSSPMALFREVAGIWPDALSVPLGWELVQGSPQVPCLTFDPDADEFAGNILVTGKNRFAGKDTWVFSVLWLLCYRNRPDQLQIVYVDGKQSDGALWQGLAHNLVPPVLGEDRIVDAMLQLRDLRVAREKQRAALRVTKWSEIPADRRPPLVVAFISELDLLERAVVTAKAKATAAAKQEKGRVEPVLIEDVEDWMGRELGTSVASGIIYIIGTQSASGRETRWRDHCHTYVAGYQDVERAVQANLNMSSKEIEQLGGISPLNFTGRGYFTVRQNRSVVTVRAANPSLEERQAALAMLPRARAGERLPVPALRESAGPIWPVRLDQPVRAPIVGAELLDELLDPPTAAAPVDTSDPLYVSVEEEEQMVTIARQVIAECQASGTQPTRTEVFRRHYQTDRKPSGPASQRLARILDKHGLIVPLRARPPEVAAAA